MADPEGPLAEPNTEGAAASDNKAPMKFSLTVPKSSSSTRAPRFPKVDDTADADASNVEYVSVFDGKGQNSSQAAVKVIPLPQNSWRPEKRMKNIMVAAENLSAAADIFEMEKLEIGSQTSVQYGLQLKKNSSDSAEARPVTAVDSDLQRYREDVAVLPDESSVADYDSIPVEEFGKAVMRGMGWEEGKPIGRNSTMPAQPVVAVRRDGRQGLGAIPAPKPEKVKKFIKPGESRKTKLTVGRIMCVIAGTNAGCRGQIAEVHGDYYTVALLESGKRLHVREKELAEVGSLEEDKAMRKLSDPHIINDGSSNHRSRGLSGERKEEYDIAEGEERDKQLARDAREISDKEIGLRAEGMKSKHSRSQSREEADHSEDARHISRRDSRDRKDHHERGKPSGVNELNHEKYKAVREKGHDETIRYHKAASSKHGQHGPGSKPLSPNMREDKNTVDSSFSKNHITDSRLHVSDTGLQKEMTRHKDNQSSKNEICAEKRYGDSGRSVASWLAPDIRVRIVDKRAYGDRFYLQKACVVDVVSPLLCDIRMDEGGRIIQKVKQEHLETALPKRGGIVMVVGGKYKGRTGRLQERDSEKGIGLVRMDDSEVKSFDLDYLAEFVGVLYEMEP